MSIYVPEHYVRHCLAIDAQLDRLTGTRDRRPEAARRADVIGRLSVDPSLYERLHSRLTDGRRHLSPSEVASRLQAERDDRQQAERAKDERYRRWADGSGRSGNDEGLLDLEQAKEAGLSRRDAFHRVKNNLRDDPHYYNKLFDRLEAEQAERDAALDAAPYRGARGALSGSGRPDSPVARSNRDGYWGD
jgi:hypothetical protein